MTFTVKLADKIIQVEHIHPELRAFCQDYLIENCTPEFSIRLTQADIDFEDKQTIDQTFSSAYMETLALLRKISDIFPNHQRFLIHGASISYEGKAYLFTAPSGTGKSTHIRLWKKFLGDKVKIVNGDKPFVSMDNVDEEGNTQPLIYGSPWAGKERWNRNCSEPLKAICFVQRGTINTIKQIQPEECLTMLFRQVYIPENEITVAQTLELIDALLKNVPVYLLTCDISEKAVRCSFEALTGMQYPN